MPAEVKVLIEGSVSGDFMSLTGEEHTQSTVTLVRDGEMVMVVDPGILPSQQVLIDALSKEGLTVNDVNMVCITHSHLDHYRNLGMFPKAKVLEYYGVWDGNTVVTWSERITENIKAIHTPGHDYSSITLIVKTGQESQTPGVVAICGDVFWRKNYMEDVYDDVFASNPEKLKDSRNTVLSMADWIIPGHGSAYKNEYRVLDDVITPSSVKKQKTVLACKRCSMAMEQRDKCRCRPYLCFRCCECGIDCDTCSCSHRR